MECLFTKIIFAHVLGDYFFQPKKMAMKKSEKSIYGYACCTLHSIIYTAFFALLFMNADPVFLALIFISHWPIDRWSLAQKWLNLIGGRSYVKAYISNDDYREIDIAFSAIVYTVVDNFIHLFLIWGIFYVLY